MNLPLTSLSLTPIITWYLNDYEEKKNVQNFVLRFIVIFLPPLIDMFSTPCPSHFLYLLDFLLHSLMLSKKKKKKNWFDRRVRINISN